MTVLGKNVGTDVHEGTVKMERLVHERTVRNAGGV